ncbi:MAG: OB-fold domain-containing protein [Halodesulfurarchaeum sp.]|nr:OB-fold domain-containing protein [Halodesulfurarchaeum sp.]
MSDEPVRDAGYDDFLDSVAEGSPYYLECAEGHGSLPPRQVCPECGNGELQRTDLPEAGTIVAHNVVHVPTPRFADDTPYATAIVDFGPVSVTGQVRVGDPHEVENGQDVGLDIDVTETDADRLLVFDPN